ncbi:Vegetative incompatibility protein HET-E-1 [Madurella mycetomatis]|uniref:Vegetative incompatibility protein HET-E-1 n=1 Tax=Madurella mycetomatis TaxID=100816 RepID=A0A175W3W9_9PEZI|nr:Vegetative incompatibility protein HET-E-1 [Madurella mycetomatis]
MAEAVAALGLAVNVLQMLDHGRQFVVAAWRVWNDEVPDTDGFTAMKTLSEDLKSALKDLRSSSSKCSGEIAELAKECAVVADELLEKLQNIGVSDATKPIEEQKKLIDQLNAAQRENEELRKRLGRSPNTEQGIGTSVVEYISNSVGEDASKDLERSLQEALVDDGQVHGQRPVLSDHRKRNLEARFLSALSYEGMDDRESSIAKAHEKTFKWVFDPDETQSQVSLPAWLESADQLYWITGKPGSGKSTLMKFISQPPVDGPRLKRPEREREPRCISYLRRWAQGCDLLVASFYFWASGSKIQATSSALYRTLLHQICTAYPDVIPIASPNRWYALCLFDSNWKPFTEHELQMILQQTMSYVHHDLGIKICLFIDGLDEFDGDHNALPSC